MDDHVDKIIAQWRRERPDLDVAPMALIGRLRRVSKFFSAGMSKTFADHGLNGASFDVLATLRRSGEPYTLSPSDLLATTMITSGTMTNRIDQLERKGFVERLPNPEDGRGFLIRLTKRGFDVVDAAVADHVKTQAQLVSGLTSSDRETLDALLKKLLGGFEEMQKDRD